MALGGESHNFRFAPDFGIDVTRWLNHNYCPPSKMESRPSLLKSEFAWEELQQLHREQIV